MKKLLLPLILSLYLSPKGQAFTFFLEGSKRHFNQQAVNDLDTYSLKSGFSYSADGFGIWGEIERFQPENYEVAHNGELAGIKNLGPINLLLGLGYSEDFRFKPSHLYLAEIQIPTSHGVTPFFAVSKEDYQAPVVNNFVYYKAGMVKRLGSDTSLLMQYQYIDNENENRTINKIGSQLAATFSYNKLNHLTQLGAQFSCTGRSLDCNKNSGRDEYFESNFLHRWWNDSAAKKWGLRGQVTYVYQKSFIIRETKSEIGRSSWIFRFGPQFEF